MNKIFSQNGLPLFLILFLSSCFPIRSIFLAYPDARDMKRFPHHEIQAGAECFEFAENPESGAGNLKISDWSSDTPLFLTIDSFAKTHPVRSFLLIQRDTIKYEYYHDELGPHDLHPSYSIAKSFTSALIGIAIEEGHIQSENEAALNYLPELDGIPMAEQLTIRHLLDHTSGIHNSLKQDATIYYGRNALKALRNLRFDAPPGSRQHYLNLNTELLGLILKRATGIPPAQYLEQKIWQPIGMCEDGLWSTDERNDMEKTYCCLGATTRDYAKFGRLYLHEGVWEGKRVLPETWYRKTISRDTTEGSSYNYNLSWYIGLKKYGDFMAIGLYKQYIYVHPEKDLIIVVLNERDKPLQAERIKWWFVFRQLVDQL